MQYESFISILSLHLYPIFASLWKCNGAYPRNWVSFEAVHRQTNKKLSNPLLGLDPFRVCASLGYPRLSTKPIACLQSLDQEMNTNIGSKRNLSLRLKSTDINWFGFTSCVSIVYGFSYSYVLCDIKFKCIRTIFKPTSN